MFRPPTGALNQFRNWRSWTSLYEIWSGGAPDVTGVLVDQLVCTDCYLLPGRMGFK